MARSRAAMIFRRLVWLALPFVGLLELGGHVYFAARAPDPHAWRELSAVVERLRKPGDLVVVAPTWAEPLARQTLGEAAMPLSDVARSDTKGYSHALEISLYDQHSSELASFREFERKESGPFLVRRLKNAEHRPVLYSFVDHVREGELFVLEWTGLAERPCKFTSTARSSAGGLGGHLTYPKERFACSGGESFFVGITLFDDARYRPRRCIYAHPLPNAVLRMRFPNVPRGRAVSGYAGLSHLISRDGLSAPVLLTAYVDGQRIGDRSSNHREGFVAFEFQVPTAGSERVEVVLEVTSESHESRDFCFVAEMR